MNATSIKIRLPPQIMLKHYHNKIPELKRFESDEYAFDRNLINYKPERLLMLL